MQINPEWNSVIDAVVSNPGVAVVVGATDVGKTTFCLHLLNASARLNVPASLIDSDVGQSEIGPPTTVGMAQMEHEIESLRELQARRLYFVGATSPVGQMLPTVVGVKRLTDLAIARGSKLVVIDTSGLVTGTLGTRLKTYKFDLLQPKHIIAIQRSTEIEPILAGFSKSGGVTIHRVRPGAGASRKPQEYRTQRRRTQFYETFGDVEGHILHLDQIVCRNTYFTTGRLLSWKHVREIEGLLRQRVLHAESPAKGLYIVTDEQPNKRAEADLMEHYNLRDVTIVPASAYKNVVLGLSDDTGLCMDVGLLQAIDFKQRYMFILSRIKTTTPIRIVQFGSMRVRPDGTELGRIKPGEI